MPPSLMITMRSAKNALPLSHSVLHISRLQAQGTRQSLAIRSESMKVPIAELLASSSSLPGVVRGVRDYLFAVGSNRHRKLNRLTVCLVVVI